MLKVARLGASKFVLVTRYHQADQIKENGVGGACGTHGRWERIV
jgi:hypothetical protein